MPYFHVLVTLQNFSESKRSVLADLSETHLQKRFLAQYRKGKTFLSGNEVIDAKQITTVTIIRTERTSAEELKTIQDNSYAAVQEFNRSQDSAVLISAGRGFDPEDIIEAGEDVTATYISLPPGEGRWSFIAAVISHPWVSTIVTGLIVAGLAAYFGWN